MAKPEGYGGRDIPDFGISDTFQTKGIISDLGELASRLGAPNVFDRSGSVIWFEQFQYGLNSWLSVRTGAGITPAYVAYPYLYKPGAVKLACDNSGAGTSQIQIILPIPYESGMGIEFAYHPVWPVTELEFYGELYTGTNRYVFDVQFKLSIGEINVYTTGPVYQNIYTDALTYHLPSVYNITKVVLDLENKCYSRVMFNKYDISAKGIPLVTNASVTRPRLTLLMRLENTALQAEACYIDNVIFTLDEPT